MITKLFNALFGWLFGIFKSENKRIAQDQISVQAYLKGLDFRPVQCVVLARSEPILLLTGTFLNHGEDTIKRLTLKVSALDGQTLIASSEAEVVGSHQAELLHGDSQAWEYRMPVNGNVTRVEISSVEIEHSELTTAPPAREARIDWEGKLPSGVLVVFRERLQRTQAFGDGTRAFCHLTIEVENSGRVLEVLKIEVSFFDEENRVIDTREALAAWKGGPPIEPGERRLVHLISKVPSNYSHYSGRVTEVR
jgi:hypothetical protein